MTIYQRGKSWYYDFVHRGQRYTGSFGPVSRTVAKEELARKKAEVVEGRLNPAKARQSPRFDAFAAEYLDWMKANRKPLTAVRVGEVLNRLKGVFGHTKLSNLTPWQIEQFKKARKDAGKAPGTINLDLSILKAMLHKAQEWGKLAEHPGKHVKLLKNSRQKTRFLSEEEEACLLAVCSPALRRVVEVGALTGFRRQELVSLRPEDVDLERGTVSVAACYAKNGESRTLPAGPRLKAHLQDALATRGNTSVVLVKRARAPLGSGHPDSTLPRDVRACAARAVRPPRLTAYLRLSLSHGGGGPPHRARTHGTQDHHHDPALRAPVPRSHTGGDGDPRRPFFW